MPKELPGFYYDEEKNRYFPVKGPIPGSSRKRKSLSAGNSGKQASQPDLANKAQNLMKSSSKLLQCRELCGNLLASRKGKLNFQTEYQKKLASQPFVWKYHGTERKVENSLEHISVDVIMPTGLMQTDVLLSGGLNGTLSFFLVGRAGQEFHDELKCMVELTWPLKIEQQAEGIIPQNLWAPIGDPIDMHSDVSCIKMCHLPADEASSKNVIITTMGSGTSRGAVHIMNLSAPLEYNSSDALVLHPLASFESTIWTADCNYNSNQVVIGTNRGASSVNLETGMSSPVFRSNSDVLSLQVDHSGNIILCGLRNGAIMTIDARQKCQEVSFRHRNPYDRGFPRTKLQRSMHRSCKISMPSSISCLRSLMLYDQYFVASSMDGSIKLYDQRLIQKGALQSYEGNVNSHTRIQLGVDPSEKIVLSGGEDCKLRLWSIKSGEMLFEGECMKSVPSVVCWPNTGGLPPKLDASQEGDYWQNHHCGIWLGSREGLFHMDWL